MTKLVVCLLVFGLFFTIQTVGHMNSDPAPGRSPGPPGIVAVPDTGHRRPPAHRLPSTHEVQLNGDEGLVVAVAAEASTLMMLDADDDGDADEDGVGEEDGQEEVTEGVKWKADLSGLPQTSIERRGVRRRKDVSYAGEPTQQEAASTDAASQTQHNVDATKMNDERVEGAEKETKQNGDDSTTTTIASQTVREQQQQQLDMLDRKQQQKQQLEEPLIDFGRSLRPMTNDKLIIDPSAAVEPPRTTTTATAAITSPPSVATTTVRVSNRLLQSTVTAHSAQSTSGCTDGLDEFLNDVTVVNELDDNATVNAATRANNEGNLLNGGFSMSLQLEHDVFDTSAAAMGINCGLVYKVRLTTTTTTATTGSSAAPGDSYYTGDFFVQSYGASSGRERGSFVSHTLGGGGGGGAVGNKLPISWLNALRRHSGGAASSSPYAVTPGSSRNGMLNNWLPNDGSSISASDESYAARRNDYNAAAAAADSSTKRKWQKDRPKNAACPDNKWHGSVKSRTSGPSGGSATDAVHLWLLNELCERNDTIEFRVYFRLKYGDNVTPTANDATDAAAAAQHTQVYRQTFRFRLNKDCQLLLREATTGTLDYTMLPLYSNECTVHFPSYEHQLKLSAAWQTPPTQIAPAGILVELQRLNVPCNGGGYVRFNGRNALCGKLEELADTERAYHFDVRHRSSVTFHSQPMFSLSYKLVDYCYNVSTSNQSGEFYIRPSTRSTLECFFRIHLPYGNRVLLRLVTNNDTAVLHAPTTSETNGFMAGGGASAEESLYALYTALGESIDTQIVNLTLSAAAGTLRYEQFPTNNASAKQQQSANASGLNMAPFGATTANCDGIVVKVFEDDYSKWSHCVAGGVSKVLAFIVESTGNTLSVHLFRADQKARYNGPYNAAPGSTSPRPSNNNQSNNNKESAFALPAIYLSYQARPRPEVVSNCAFGWIAMQQFCVTAVADLQLPWHEAEQHCVALGGHLVSIRNEGQQQIINELLLRSPGYQDQNAYWVGGSDNSYEGDFRWSDGLLFQYTNWFPGWSQHDQTMYNKQPNDDGLSSQDCIELRRFFRTPPGIQSTRSPLTTNFMWNDRDCSAKNFLICEQAMSDDSFRRNWINDCNKTVSLTKEHPRASIWSPSFPRQYPDNANCFTTITAPSGYRIVIEFEELVIENEPGCTYDYLEITEPTLSGGEASSSSPASQRHKTTPNGTRNFRKRNSYELYGGGGDDGDGNNDIITEPNDVTDNYLYNNNYNGQSSPSQSYQHLNIFSHLYKAHTDYVIQTPDYPKGNPYAHGAANSGHIMPKRLCGDWSSKLKLLRHVSRGSYLGLHFVSDYSHHFGGYKAKTYMENRSHLLRAASECANERLKLYNGSCYLFISYPEVDWWTAQQVCRGMGAKLSSVSTADEHRFITSNIRNQIDYSPQLIYWLGAELEKNGQFEWTDDTKMSFQGWLPGQGQFDVMPSDATCLGLQWKMSPTPMLPSGLYWQSQKCNKVGGYVCKKPKESFGKYAFSNFTVTGSEGRLVSPAYPNTYPLNIDYWIHIKAPERTRIVVQFQKIDLESQDECLYDFVSIQNYELISHITLEPGTNPLPMAMLTSDSRMAFWDDSDTDPHSGSTLHYDDDAILQLQHRLPRSLDGAQDDELRTRQRRSISSNNFMAQSQFQINHKTPNGLRRSDDTPANERDPSRANLHQTEKKSFSILDSQWRRRSSRNMPPAELQQQQSGRNVMAPQARGRHMPPAKPHENPKRRRRKKFRPEIANRREAKQKPELRRIRRNSPPQPQQQQQSAADHGVTQSDNAQSFLPYVRWCGQHDSNMSKFDFVSSSNQAVLNFHSDYSVTGLGFAAIWKAIDVSGCPLRTLTSREGAVISPNYPHFLLNNLNCAYVIQAPVGRRVWLEFTDYDLRADAMLAVDIGLGQIRPFRESQHLNEGIFVSVGEQLRVQFRTGQHPRGKGFQAIYHTVGQLERRERIIQLASNTTGHLFQLNYPNDMPENVDFTQHLVAPFGDNILLELHGVEFSDNGCPDNNILEIYDNYADNNGTKWQLCQYRSPPDEGAPAIEGDNPLSNEAENPYGYHGFDQESQRQQQYHQQQHHHQQQQHEGQQQRHRHEEAPPPVYITSYLNTLHIRQRTTNAKFDANLNASIHMQWDNNYKMKLASGDKNVEACQPNPCQFNGKCVTSNGSNYCQCQGHYTGRFCGLTVCELEPCIFGKCVLTASSFNCQCQPGYMGTTCEQKQRPCADNPCEGRGICIERNGGYFCRCHAWWEGHRCERRMMHIPYKPLSERMLQEPFWLGLITVFVVLAVIGLVWCAKRHFPEKIEKLLAEEADRNRPPGSIHGHHHHTSLREQLQFTTSIPQGTAAAAQGGAPRSIFNRLGIRKPSLLSLSSPNPISGGGGGAAARTFSLDDLLRPPPRRSPSPRKKRNNSTPVKKNAAEKKQILQQLVSPAAAQTPTAKLSLGELISMSENRLRVTNNDSESDVKETTFSENSGSLGSATVARVIADPKLEKKVTFARLLNKVSAEMSSGSEVDIGQMAGTRNSSALSLPTDIQFRASSMPPSPCTNDIRSPHSTSSNQGSDSLSSSDMALTDFGLRSMQTSGSDIGGSTTSNHIAGLGGLVPPSSFAAMSRGRFGASQRPKMTSADSILAMLRNFGAASASTTLSGPSATTTGNISLNGHTPYTTAFMPLPTSASASLTTAASVFVSPSQTPTVSSPQDDAPGDDESSTSSMHTPVSFSSGAPDSPVFYRQTTIEVPVLDVLNAHKNHSGSQSSSASSSSNNLLHPPTILLEIPSAGINNKCLSPIREMPTPMPSPALTPIMPRPNRSNSPIFQEDPLYGDYSDDDQRSDHSDTQLSEKLLVLQKEQQANPLMLDSDVETTPTDTTTTSMADSNKPKTYQKLPLKRMSAIGGGSLGGSLASALPTNILVPPIITIDVEPPTPEERAVRPRDLIIPTLTVEQPSPTKNRHPMIIFPGSPPPQRASIGETSFMFPNKQQQKRLLKQFEKPTSLEFPFVPPMITITSNMSELESDTEPMSPAPKTGSAGGLMPPNPVGMCYLSPFTMCTRADRTISESNLSSSGYSSMASPGPSRCGSSNPLCPNEMDEPGSGHSGAGLSLHVNLMNRRRSSALASCKENITNGKGNGSGSSTTASVSLAANSEQLLQHRIRPRSDSETFSDDIVVESNDEGIGTDHVDEKLDDSRLNSSRFKELDVFMEEHVLIEVDEPVSVSSSLLGLSGSATPSGSASLLVPSLGGGGGSTPASPNLHQQMAQLQLPSIVIQIDGNEKGLSPVSSRSESPLSERAGIGRFSPHFYGRKDQLPFTDSDGLYDFPSSDGKGGTSAPTYTHQRRSNSKKRERKSSKCSLSQSPTKQQLDVPPKEQQAQQSASPTATSTPTPLSGGSAAGPMSMHVCSKHCHSHHHPCPAALGVQTRKSPKRRQVNRLPVASSSSSSESLISPKELTVRQLPRRLNSPNREKRPRKQESLSEEEVADALLRRISPSLVKEEEPPKPKCKINRLRAIGNQIRFLRRLKKSIKTRERLASPSDSCPEENTDDNDSPQATSPLLQPTSPTKTRLGLCRQKRLPSDTYGITAAEMNTSNWKGMDRSLIGDDLNSD